MAKINVHQQNPDSLVWNKINTNFPTEVQKQKAVFANNQIFIFTEQASQVAVTMMEIGTNEWTALQNIDIPVKADYTSAMIWDGQFYILAENQLYTSSNGLNWRKVETEQSIKQLTANMALEAGKKLIGIDMENQYIESENGMNWNTFENIPEDFPTQNVSFAAYPLATNASLAKNFYISVLIFYSAYLTQY